MKLGLDATKKDSQQLLSKKTKIDPRNPSLSDSLESRASYYFSKDQNIRAGYVFPRFASIFFSISNIVSI